MGKLHLIKEYIPGNSKAYCGMRIWDDIGPSGTSEVDYFKEFGERACCKTCWKAMVKKEK